ncbi:metalloprotease family protein [Bacillus paralicheniformis]|uniref:metalloprotease family protein n=1 Tax=Bacillus paralicheniformis TaxID=1648923 RepID=UPI003D1DFA67
MEKLTSSSPWTNIIYRLMLFIIVFMYLGSILCLSSFRQIDRVDLQILYILLNWVSFLVTSVLLSVVHENAHSFTASHFGIRTEVSYFPKPYSFKPYCAFDKNAKIKKSDFRKIAIAPLITISLVLIPLCLLSLALFQYCPELFINIFILYIYKVTGCISDLKLFKDARRLSNNQKLIQSEDRGAFEVI